MFLERPLHEMPGQVGKVGNLVYVFNKLIEMCILIKKKRWNSAKHLKQFELPNLRTKNPEMTQ